MLVNTNTITTESNVKFISYKGNGRIGTTEAKV